MDSNGKIYDSRVEDKNEIHRIFKEILSRINFIKDDLTNEILTVYDITYVKSFNQIKNTDMFTFYLTNNYQAINAYDLTKISSWLDETWATFLNSTQSSIYVLNNELYFHRG
jgi:hypothetical protein